MSQVVGTVVFLLLVATLVGIGAWIGWQFAFGQMDRDAEQVEQQKAELREQWDALHRTQRINAAFWQARQALRSEVMRHSRGADRQ